MRNAAPKTLPLEEKLLRNASGMAARRISTQTWMQKSSAGQVLHGPVPLVPFHACIRLRAAAKILEKNKTADAERSMAASTLQRPRLAPGQPQRFVFTAWLPSLACRMGSGARGGHEAL